jgi:uncharacterized surface protein with fasciclin (FAS1) repeats
MRSITIILFISVNLISFACSNRSTEEDNSKSSGQPPVLESPFPDSNLNEIDGTSDTSKTIAENIADRPDMVQLASGLESAELIASLSGPGPFTIFAPVDSAFNAAGIRVKKSPGSRPDKKMHDLLVNHIVSGFYRTNDLRSGMELSTIQDGKIRISVENGSYRIDGSTIITKNIIAKNGVIHIIDQVLNPADSVSAPR